MVKVIIYLILFTSTVQAQNEYFGFPTVEEKTQFLEGYFSGERSSKEDLERFQRHTDIQEKTNALPWSFTADWYKLIRGAGMLFQVHQILSVENFEVAAEHSTMLVDGIRVANPAVAIAAIAEAVTVSFELAEVGVDFKSLYGTNPGTPIRLLAVKYEAFANLLQNLEIIKALQEHQDTKSLELMGRVVADSALHFTRVSRELAGLKMATGGLVVAYNMEALIAASLLDLSEEHREVVFKGWQNGYEKVVKQEVSWFSGIGGARETFKGEAETLLEDLRKSTSDAAFNKTVQSSTLSHKTGVLLVGLLQENLRTAEIALVEIEKSEERLRSLGIESERLSTILKPLSSSATFSRSAVDSTALWALGGASFIESAMVGGVSAVASLGVRAYEAIPRAESLIPEVPSVRSFGRPTWFGGSQGLKCSKILK